MEAVGVESDGILLIFSHFNDLDKYFWQCFSFSRDLRDHYCPLLQSAKNVSHRRACFGTLLQIRERIFLIR
jgi:hypothetical protein